MHKTALPEGGPGGRSNRPRPFLTAGDKVIKLKQAEPELLHQVVHDPIDRMELPLDVPGLVDVHLRPHFHIDIFGVNEEIGDDAGDEKAHEERNRGGEDVFHTARREHLTDPPRPTPGTRPLNVRAADWRDPRTREKGARSVRLFVPQRNAHLTRSSTRRPDHDVHSFRREILAAEEFPESSSNP